MTFQDALTGLSNNTITTIDLTGQPLTKKQVANQAIVANTYPTGPEYEAVAHKARSRSIPCIWSLFLYNFLT